MNYNQIEYWKLQETKRANLAKEGLTDRQLTESERSNRMNEYLTGTRDAETARSNKAKESLTSTQIKETQRSNLAQERLKHESNLETKRSNLANEQIKRDTNKETNRANLAKESLSGRTISETERSNLANEELKDQMNSIQKVRNQWEKEFTQKRVSNETRETMSKVALNTAKIAMDALNAKLKSKEISNKNDVERKKLENEKESLAIKLKEYELAERKFIESKSRNSTNSPQKHDSTKHGGGQPRSNNKSEGLIDRAVDDVIRNVDTIYTYLFGK